MTRRSIVFVMLALGLAGCGGGTGTQLSARVTHRLAVAKATKSPAYWLGTSFDGLKLVHVDSGSDAFFKSELYYADCSWFDMNTLSTRCRRTIEVDNDVPTRGEISTMGRCIFSTTIHGVTVATFPVNPAVLRVFARAATVMVAGRHRSETLAAIRALEPLNGHPLEHRDVSAVLGTCKAPRPKPRVHLTAKQRYEQRMKGAWYIPTISSITLSSFTTAAKPKAVLGAFLAGLRTEPPTLRNEAARIEQVAPPADVASAQRRLVDELRAYAGVLDTVLSQARRDGLDDTEWAADMATLQPRIGAAQSALIRTVKGFQARGYSIFVKPSD